MGNLLKAIAVEFVASCMFVPASAHDGARRHGDLEHCVEVSVNHQDTKLLFTISNNCSVGAHVSWCWQRKNGNYSCMNSDAKLSTLATRWAMLAPGKTIRDSEFAPSSKYWFSACIAEEHSYDAVAHAKKHCGLKNNYGRRITKGEGSQEVRVAE